jgi:glucokinase
VTNPKTDSPILAVDLGGTNLRMGLVTRQGRVVARSRAKLGVVTAKDALCDKLALKIGGFRDKMCGGRVPGAVAVGFAGPTDSASGRVYFAPNVGGLDDLHLAVALESRLGMRAIVANDADCAALGEYWQGAGRGAGSLFLFTLGTGLGGAMVIDGGLWEGSQGIAGEIGHTIVDLDGPLCACGKRGCLEALVSATALVREYRARKGVKGGKASVTARAVFQLARRGDPAALHAVDAVSRALGVGISNIFLLLNPDLILIGGGVARAGKMLIGPAIEYARGLIFPQLSRYLVVKRASLGDDAGLVGAAYLAYQRMQTARRE